MALTEEQIVARAEQLLRHRPKINELTSEDALSWRAEIRALLKISGRTDLWVEYKIAEPGLDSEIGQYNALPKVLVLLKQLVSEARLSLVGPASTAIETGGVFDYFDSIRKIVETATSDVLFVDPYLDADFVTRYFPCIPSGVSVRLLGGKFGTLVPALEMYANQHGTTAEARDCKELHDRFLILDGAICYQSGSSFKDGARKAGTVINQILDMAGPIIEQYEQHWLAGTRRYPAQ